MSEFKGLPLNQMIRYGPQWKGNQANSNISGGRMFILEEEEKKKKEDDKNKK